MFGLRVVICADSPGLDPDKFKLPTVKFEQPLKGTANVTAVLLKHGMMKAQAVHSVRVQKLGKRLLCRIEEVSLHMFEARPVSSNYQ